MKVKNPKFVVQQSVMPFASGPDNTFVPVCLGGKGPEMALAVDKVFDSRSWVNDLMARPVSAREVNS